MRFSLRAVAVLLVASLGFACGGGSTPQQTQSAPPGSTAAAPPASAPEVAAGDFGVPECDAFFKKWVACVDEKIPEAGRATFRQSIEQTKTAWKQAASTPEGKTALAQTCTQMEATVKQQLTSYGCAW